MKNNRIIAIFFAFFIVSVGLSAQSADKVIEDYIDALGGQKKLDKITSVQMKSQIVSDMFEGDATTTILNGKGFKMEMDVMGYMVETCYTDEGAWRSDPMSGEIIQFSDEEYQMGKGAIYLAGFFQDYKELGMTAELVGKADINGVNTHHIRLSKEGSEISTEHFFDAKTNLLIRTKIVVVGDQGEMEVINDYKDYKEIDGGVKMAHVTDIDYGGQMVMTNTISEVKVNVDVDMSIFKSE